VFLVERVLHDKGRHDANPDLQRLEGQVAKGLPELRVNAEPLPDGLRGRENFRPPAARKMRALNSSRTNPEYATR
jgi:hypothetical protein